MHRHYQTVIYKRWDKWYRALSALRVEITNLLLALITGRGNIAGWRLALFLVHFTLWCVCTTAAFGAVTCGLQRVTRATRI